MRLGDRHRTSYALLIPKILIKKYHFQDEERLLLEEDDENKALMIKKIGSKP
jgi:hypothetical protein